MAWTETIDGCGCCGCCGNLRVLGISYTSSDPGPNLYLRDDGYWVWFWSTGSGVYEEYVSVSSRSTGLPETIPKQGPIPDYIDVVTTAKLTAPIDCGTVVLPAGSTLRFIKTGDSTPTYQTNFIEVCNE